MVLIRQWLIYIYRPTLSVQFTYKQITIKRKLHQYGLRSKKQTLTRCHSFIEHHTDWFHGLTDHLTFYSAQRLDLFAWCVRLSRLLVGFRTHFESLHFHSFIHSFTCHQTRAFTPQLHGITALWPILTEPSHAGMARLSSHGWMPCYIPRLIFLQPELTPDTVTHPNTDRARRTATLLMWSNTLPLSQVANFSVLAYINNLPRD